MTNRVVSTRADKALERPSFDGLWAQYDGLSDEELQSIFREAKSRNDPADVARGLRAFSAVLQKHAIIGMTDYVGIFGGLAAQHLSQTVEGCFVDMTTGNDATKLAEIYSRAKYGSIEDIRTLAGIVVSMLECELLDPASDWRRMFEHARAHDESVVMMTTGWRNVPSTANVLYKIVLEHINVVLADLRFPTLIDVKLPRIATPCENYPSLTTEERQRISVTQDHVIPSSNFYQWSRVHVIFGDDVLVTGSTADKVYRESMRNGALSCRSIYPIALDPAIALNTPSVEEQLNKSKVSGALDCTVASFLAHRDNVPVLRALRLIFDASTSKALPDFLHRLPTTNLLALYVSALGNDFQNETSCIESLLIVRRYLAACGLLDNQGLPNRPWVDFL